jgi:hypothetical protein
MLEGEVMSILCKFLLSLSTFCDLLSHPLHRNKTPFSSQLTVLISLN